MEIIAAIMRATMARRVKSPQMKLRQIADDLAKAKCRARGVCQAKGLDHLTCAGALQWCHIVERSHLGLRWSQENCLLMCQAHHLFYTYRPFQWTLFVERHFRAQWLFVRENISSTFDGNYLALIERIKEEQ